MIRKIGDVHVVVYESFARAPVARQVRRLGGGWGGTIMAGGRVMHHKEGNS